MPRPDNAGPVSSYAAPSLASQTAANYASAHPSDYAWFGETVAGPHDAIASRAGYWGDPKSGGGFLSGVTDWVSNALGTDGSKNGLLNDPISMGLLAAGIAITTGYVDPTSWGSAAASSAGGTVAAEYASEVALTDLAIVEPLGSSTVASVTAGSAAAATGAALTDLAMVEPLGSSTVASVTAESVAPAFTLPTWLTPSNVLGAATTATKINNLVNPKAAPLYGMPTYNITNAPAGSTPSAYRTNTVPLSGTPDNNNTAVLLVAAVAAAAFLARG